MYLIAGLGNPGREYEKTRHNMGFQVIDKLADKISCNINENKHSAVCGKAVIGSERVILAKPQTYMNNSGESIRAIADFYKIATEDIIIIFDDIDLAPGVIRIRKSGSAGGHNGIKSIISHLGSQDFPRVRIGVGAKPVGWDLADHVLSRPSKEEEKLIEEAQKKAVDAIICMIEDGIDKAMNNYNKK